MKGLNLGFIDIIYLLPDLRGSDSAWGTQYPRSVSKHLSHMPYMEPFVKTLYKN